MRPKNRPVSVGFNKKPKSALKSYNYQPVSSQNDNYDSQTKFVVSKRLERKAKLVQSHSSINGQLFITGGGKKNLDNNHTNRYKMIKFEDYEINNISNTLKKEKLEWSQIQDRKRVN